MKCRMETSAISDLIYKENMKDSNSNNNGVDPVKTGEFIKKLRKSRKLTQEQLGAQLFITRKAVSKWENGVCCPSLDLLKRLSDLLEVSVDELTNGEYSNTPLRHTKLGKIFRNKHIRRTSIFIISSSFLLLLLFFILSFGKTRSYVMNYESDSFSMVNGRLFISQADCYISLGNFSTNFTDVDKNTQFSFILMIKDKQGLKKVLDFDRTEITSIEKDVANDLKNNIDNLSIKVSYRNVRGEDIEFVFKPKISINTDNKINDTVNDNSPTKYLDSREEDILNPSKDKDADVTDDENYADSTDVSFLYDVNINDLYVKLNGKYIKSNDYKFQISVDVSLNLINIFTDNISVVINYNDNTMFINSDKSRLYKIENNLVNIKSDYDEENKMLCNILKKLSELID